MESKEGLVGRGLAAAAAITAALQASRQLLGPSITSVLPELSPPVSQHSIESHLIFHKYPKDL